MTPEQEVLIRKLPDFEGTASWMYLDTHKPNPLVTIATGCAIGLEEAMALPFVIGGRTATPPEIADAYGRVQQMPGGMLAHAYRYTECPELPQEAQDALVAKRLSAFSGELHEIFPDYDNFPIGPKVGLLDLIYGVGPGGFRKYPHLIAAANATPPNWKKVAENSAANPSIEAFDVRNLWRQDQILSALKLAYK
jgi:hypothetical protein